MCTCGFALCSDPNTSAALSDPLADRITTRLDALAQDTDLTAMTRLAYAHAAEIVRNEAQR